MPVWRHAAVLVSAHVAISYQNLWQCSGDISPPTCITLKQKYWPSLLESSHWPTVLMLSPSQDVFTMDSNCEQGNVLGHDRAQSLEENESSTTTYEPAQLLISHWHCVERLSWCTKIKVLVIHHICLHDLYEGQLQLPIYWAMPSLHGPSGQPR